MRADRQEDVEVARRTALQAGLAFAGKPDPGPVLHPLRNVDGECAFLGDPPGAGTVAARVGDHLPAPVTGRAGPLHREEGLGRAHLALAAAGRAGGRARARFGAGADAGLAADAGGDPDLGGLAVERLLEVDLHIVAQVRAALVAAPAAAPAPAHELAEQVFEDVRHGTREVVAETGPRAEAALFEGGMSELVVGRLALRVLQHLVGFVDFLELGFRRSVAIVDVGMELLCEFAVGAFQRRRIHAPVDAQHFIVVALRHNAQPVIHIHARPAAAA